MRKDSSAGFGRDSVDLHGVRELFWQCRTCYLSLSVSGILEDYDYILLRPVRGFVVQFALGFQSTQVYVLLLFLSTKGYQATYEH